MFRKRAEHQTRQKRARGVYRTAGAPPAPVWEERLEALQRAFWSSGVTVADVGCALARLNAKKPRLP